MTGFQKALRAVGPQPEERRRVKARRARASRRRCRLALKQGSDSAETYRNARLPTGERDLY